MKFVFDFIMLVLVSTALTFPIRNMHEKWKRIMKEEQQEK